MKKLIGLLLAFTLLCSIAAPAFAMETKATGEYRVDVNLEVPENSDEFGSFTVWIPDSVDLQYGVEDMYLHYGFEFDYGRFPVGKKVSFDIVSDYFHEWDWEDEEGEKHYEFLKANKRPTPYGRNSENMSLMLYILRL